MRVTFSESGMLEVLRDGVELVSKHRQEREAIESILKDAEATGATRYEIRRGVIRVQVINDAPPPVAVPAGAINGALTV